jgi:hypothetical protein
MIALGQLAQYLNQTLGRNGHRPDMAGEIIEQIVNERG